MASYKFLHIDHLNDGTPIAVLKDLDDGSYERFDLNSIRRRIERRRDAGLPCGAEISAEAHIVAAMSRAEQATKTRTVRDQLADLIADHKLGGSGYNWRVDIIFPNRYEREDRHAAIEKIAGFVRDSIMEGSFPTWKVTVSRSVDLDREID